MALTSIQDVFNEWVEGGDIGVVGCLAAFETSRYRTDQVPPPIIGFTSKRSSTVTLLVTCEWVEYVYINIKQNFIVAMSLHI